MASDIKTTPTERLISGLSYVTGGFVGIIWLIICSVSKRPTSAFLLFNIYQAICLSLFIWFANILFTLIHDLLILIPYVKILVNAIRLAAFSPIFYNWSLAGLIIFIIYLYLVILSLFGRMAYLPWISKIILYQIDRLK